MKVTTVARQMINVAAFSITRNQASALLIIFACMMPIAAPIPAWAYDLHLPAERKERLADSSPMPSLSEISNSIRSGVVDSVSNLFNRNTDDLRKVITTTTEDKKNVKENSVDGEDVSTKFRAEADKKELAEANAEESIDAESEVEKETIAPMLVEATDQEVRDSTYDPENNLGTPPNKTELDSPNRAAATKIRHRAGAANFSFDVPFASLPGRGIDASVGMTYNSRVWNKTGDGATAAYQFDVDKNWLAPGFTVGYGNIKSHFWSKRIYLPASYQFKTFNEVIPDGITDANGTRHAFACIAEADIPGTAPGNTYGLPTKYCSEYGTTDGSFIKLTYYGSHPISNDITDDLSAYASTYFMLTYPDGTKVMYSVPGSQFAAGEFAREHYPVQIQDANGNQVDIAYKNGRNSIDYIRDTLGRRIKFYYDSTDETKLVAVTVPGYDGAPERQTIRFYYETLTLNFANRFSGSPAGPPSYRALRFVYFPGTSTGYRYDYHPDLGMITRITKLTGMTVNPDTNPLTSTGSVNTGATEAAATTYLFPNDGSQTPLTDVPKFTQRTDTWQDLTSRIANTYYDVPEPSAGADRVSRTIVDDTDFDVEYATVSHNTDDWQNGLPKETSVTKIHGPTGQYRTLMSKTVYSWKQGIADANGRRLAVLEKTEVTNDAGQVRATGFDYDGYNNQKTVIEYDFAPAGQLGTELRRTETAYETRSPWVDNRMVRLPVEIKVTVNNTTVSKTVYEYDIYSTPLEGTPEVVQHNAGYDTNWATRGNVTKVINFANAEALNVQNDPYASQKSFSYDITGNVVGVVGMSCCNAKQIEYSADFKYAYPTQETRGTSTQLLTKATYDYNTGLLRETRDENDQLTKVFYDSFTLRQTRVEYPNGAWSTAAYNDSVFPYSVQTTSSLDTTRSISSWSYVNGAGQTFRSRSLTANGYLSNDVDFDQLGRAVKKYNPYTVAGLSDPRPTGIKATEITEVDALGRVLKTKLQDETIVQTEITGTVATTTDQAGKQRRQIGDALGRIVEVHEPDVTGNLGSVTSPAQPTYYRYDGNDNLSKVTQTEGSVTQERVFEYDSLSRLLRERQVEAIPTLDTAGLKGPSSPTKWTGVYQYTGDGLLDWGVDARGVKSDFSYDGLNRVEKVEYFGEAGYKTPTVSYVYSEARTDGSEPYYNNGRLTTVQSAEINEVGQTTPKTIQRYDYDKVGQVKRHRQTIGTNEYALEYGYNLAGHMTSEKYPSGKIVNMTVDQYGVVQTVADAQRTYMNGVTSAYTASGMTSQVTLGNGTTESFTLNERFQLTSQTLMRGTEVLQKYNYNYGDLDSSSNLKNNGKLEQIESYIGSAKQWTQNFRYDSIGRLRESAEKRGDTGALTYKQVFDFDRFGNLYRKAGSNPTAGQQNPIPFTPIEETTTPGTGDIDKSTNRFRTGTTYDAAGQVTTDNKFRSMDFAYDANGRVVKATKASTPDATTVYDALGNRVATKINDAWQYMIYDAFGQLVAEYGVPSDGAGGVKFIQQDHQGSVRTITNASGFVVSRTDHQAFGEAIGSGVGLRNVNQGYSNDVSTRQSYGLTEKDDSSGQQHAWFRKLETQAGRWSSPDPYKGSMSAGDPQSFNRYSYVGNEPLNYVDPSGLLPNDNCPPGSVLPDGTCYVGVVRTRVPGSRDNAVQLTQWSGWTLTNRDIGEPDIQQDDPLPFNSCAEFVDWLVRFAESKPFGIQDKHSRAKVTGLALMDLAFNGYGRHINNGFAGFKAELVNPGEGTEEGPQGAGVYGHILGMGGAYLAGVMTGGRIAGWANSAIDHLQNSVIGKAQGPAEVAGNKAGTRAGRHIWNLIRGDGTSTNLRESLTADLCE